MKCFSFSDAMRRTSGAHYSPDKWVAGGWQVRILSTKLVRDRKWVECGVMLPCCEAVLDTVTVVDRSNGVITFG